jgi:hypothetical protein
LTGYEIACPPSPELNSFPMAIDLKSVKFVTVHRAKKRKAIAG